MKVLNLILASNGTAYSAFETQWARYMHSSPQVESYFYKARQDLKTPYELSGNTLWIQMPDTMATVYAKTVKALAFFRPRFAEFDFILRPNMSSLFIFDRYLTYLATLPPNRCIEGVFVHSYGYTYPSGCGFTITPDVAELLITSTSVQYHMDDVTIGKIAHENGIKVKLRGFLCVEPDTVSTAITKLKTAPGLFHLRFKTDNRQRDSEAYSAIVDSIMSGEVRAAASQRLDQPSAFQPAQPPEQSPRPPTPL
jgi:hypothetical protein